MEGRNPALAGHPHSPGALTGGPSNPGELGPSLQSSYVVTVRGTRSVR